MRICEVSLLLKIVDQEDCLAPLGTCEEVIVVSSFSFPHSRAARLKRSRQCRQQQSCKERWGDDSKIEMNIKCFFLRRPAVPNGARQARLE